MKRGYVHILVAYDGSKNARQAVKKAVGVAQEEKAKLTVANVMDTRRKYKGRSTKKSKDFKGKNRKEMREHIEYVLKRYDLTDVEYVIRIDEGNPKTKIAQDIAREVDADLIVCGKTGYGTFDRLVMGSISQHIVRHAKVDVLVVK
ncbi:universal stress protein [Texcoconibacillus texcoconensis]|uniref:Universal stress protein n=1 Tax=Texcoconibacillus texcoconensis TaxID=1095777 RepID=A0A840QTQ4_9BACI|nr:universal stress protein [Texcoconibacillus texcoconensis]MBB5174678.1 nucleotide-binding universal stress UspA family protein [Texcoconibacillus texcoconensis]